MFRLRDTTGGWVYSASDLVTGLSCEFQLRWKQAEKAGVIPKLDVPEDALLAELITLGLEHEEKILQQLREQYGEAEVVTPLQASDAPSYPSRAALEQLHTATQEALAAGPQVVYQGAFFDGAFHGFADFLIRVDAPGSERGFTYEPYDTKLARSERVGGMMQLAAYAQQLIDAGWPRAANLYLWLGDRSIVSRRAQDLLPLARRRMDRMQQLLALSPAEPEWAQIWEGKELFTSCGQCAYCQAAIAAHDDVWQVAGIRKDQRLHLLNAGITSMPELAQSIQEVSPEGISQQQFEKLRAQAQMQVGGREGQSDIWRVLPDLRGVSIPPPDEGDVFFDFEGDPLYDEPNTTHHGLEYLFGFMYYERGEYAFRGWWCENYEEERAIFERFMDWLEARRQRFPGMHVYHYAAYEQSALRRLAGRYGSRERLLDELLAAGVFVDLYPVVRGSILAASPSYGLKSIEKLYMGDQLRESDVETAGESVVAFRAYQQALVAGEQEQATSIRASILDYNEYDCLATLKLRDWLLKTVQIPTRVSSPLSETEVENKAKKEHTTRVQLLSEHIWRCCELWREEPELRQRTEAEINAWELLAAALEYHVRERKSFWWAHFDRLLTDPEEWSSSDTLLATHVAELTTWEEPQGRAKLWRREIIFRGEYTLEFKLKKGQDIFLIYESPPKGRFASAGTQRFVGRGEITEVSHNADAGLTHVKVREKDHEGCWPDLPFALTPNENIRTDSIERALLNTTLEALAVESDPDNVIPMHVPELTELLAGQNQLPVLPKCAELNMLLRTPITLAAAPETEPITQIVQTLLASPDAYMAVQGPPGAGKTFVGSHVIAELVVKHGWKVGITAQAHRTIENLLHATAKAGVPARQQAKKAGRDEDATTDVPWLIYEKGEHVPQFLREASGFVLGGTVWAMTDRKALKARQLDLLVIDEAGQFSLADTLAAARSAKRVLVLGDPQQLPQVSQGTHPAPVETAALSWLMQGHQTLPAEYGIFLAHSWRMHPAVCEVVSGLSYENRLRSAPQAPAKEIVGYEPGVFGVPVAHSGRQFASPEEVSQVIDLIQGLLGRTWREGEQQRPLDQDDVLVVAPYNAQVNLLRQQCDEIGLDQVRIGTVDKFQGQEAPVVIVSLTASELGGGRGADFLVNRNRLNVAISRAKYLAYLVHGDALCDFMPTNPDTLADLGALVGILDR